MTRIPVTSATHRNRLIGVIGLIAAVLASPRPASAQHRAQLDGRLAEEIARNSGRTFNVIVDGPQSEMDRVARAYGLRIVKRLDSGALLSGTPSSCTSTCAGVERRVEISAGWPSPPKRRICTPGTRSTRDKNRQGFMSSHAVNGSRVAEKIKSGAELDATDWGHIDTIAPRYTRQLAVYFRAKMLLEQPELQAVAALFSAN